jgi:hypothetical protein
MGHERGFRHGRWMSAYLLTAAEQLTSANRCLGPITDDRRHSKLLYDQSRWLRSSRTAARTIAVRDAMV